MPQMHLSTKQTQRLDGLELEQAAGSGEGPGSLACCGLRGRQESATERLD